jgi:flagellar hook-associated protein 3 FlgL
MITNLDPSSALFAANLNSLEQRLDTANEQISSGKKINVASDAPDQIGELLQLRADQQHNSQVQSNLSLAQTNATAADNALQSAIQLMNTATQLATQGANETQTAATRTDLAQQVQSLQEEMVAYSQTQVQGNYIFSGDQPQGPQYQLDLSAPKGVDQLSIAASTQQIEDPAGGSFPASMTAQQIFDDTDTVTDADGNTTVVPASDNVFNALNTLRVALLKNDQTGIANSLSLIRDASNQLNAADAFYGAVENRVQDATNFATNYGTQLQTEIGNMQDTDIPTADMQLTQDETQLEAAFTIQGKMPTSTLFNYLG